MLRIKSKMLTAYDANQARKYGAKLVRKAAIAIRNELPVSPELIHSLTTPVKDKMTRQYWVRQGVLDSLNEDKETEKLK